MTKTLKEKNLTSSGVLEKDKPGYRRDYKTSDPAWFSNPPKAMQTNTKPLVKWKKLNPEAQIPEYQTKLAAGMDVRSIEAVTLAPNGGRALIGTGLSMALPEGFECQVRSRSGLASKGVIVANAPGTIDADYRGELKVILMNLSAEPFQIQKGDRVAQLVVAACVQADNKEVANLDETERGSGGFGSTGIK